MKHPITLYSYYRSSSAYRVRIVLELKGLKYNYKAVHLLNEGGEQHRENYLQKNPMAQVPSLEHEGQVLNQSLAIIQYLEEMFPEPSLLGASCFERAKMIECCELINSGIQPLQNLNVLQKLVKDHGFSEGDKTIWCQHWIHRGFLALEKLLRKSSQKFAMGSCVSIVDAYLIPQVYNAHRFQMNLEEFPRIQQVNENALQLPEFQRAHPDQQPDAPP